MKKLGAILFAMALLATMLPMGVMAAASTIPAWEAGDGYVLTWDEVDGAQTYTLRIYVKNSNNNVLFKTYAGLTVTTLDVEADLDRGTYLATVEAFDAGGTTLGAPAIAATGNADASGNKAKWVASTVPGTLPIKSASFYTGFWGSANFNAPLMMTNGNYVYATEPGLSSAQANISSGAVAFKVDLGEECNITKVVVYTAYVATHPTYTVKISSDDTTYSSSQSLTNGSQVGSNGTSGYRPSTLTANLTGRYLDFASTIAAKINITEIEVYGTPVPPAGAPDAPEDVAWAGLREVSWTAVEGAASYKVVLYKDNAVSKTYTDVTETSIDLSADMLATGAYSAVVSAVDETGELESAASAVTPYKNVFEGNIAAGKTVTPLHLYNTDRTKPDWYENSNSKAVYTVDEDIATRIQSYSSLSSSSLVVDLGAVYDLSEVAYYTAHNTTTTWSYKVEVSDTEDGTYTSIGNMECKSTPAFPIMNTANAVEADDLNTARRYFSLAKASRGRYIKISANNATNNKRIYEIVVKGELYVPSTLSIAQSGTDLEVSGTFGEASADLMVAQYSDAACTRLVKVDIISLESKGAISETVAITSGAAYAKAFLFDGLATLTPLSDSPGTAITAE